jgi:hypothetical protein
MEYLQYTLQVIAGLGILNVWLLRPKLSTSYRGGSASNIKEEFAHYGLPSWSVYLIGFLKIASALGLIVGIFISAFVIPFASLLALLMIGALAMHLKVSDPFKKSMPALAVLTLCLGILALAL